MRERVMTRRVAAAGLMAVAALAGCAAQRNKGPVVVRDTAPQQIAEAQRLAEQALKAQKAAKSEEAIGLYRQSLDRSQDLPLVWNNLGLLLMERGDYLDAADAFQSAAVLIPSDPRPYYNVGLVYEAQHWYQDALNYFVKALERDPRYLPALRGAVAMGQQQVVTDQAALDRVHTAMLLEKDPLWRRLDEQEQLRIENELKAQRTTRSRGWESASPPPPPPPLPGPEMSAPEAPTAGSGGTPTGG
jgi:tetratricopeptide (TPR) repeat protein